MSNTERRQLGAMLMIERDKQPYGGEVFVLADQPKLETSAYFTKFNANLRDQRWSLPAGGRDMRPDGTEETVQETLRREFGEELTEAHTFVHSPTDLELVLSAANKLFANGAEVEQLALPFIVAQLAPETKVMNILAVTSLRIQFDALSREEQAVLEQAVSQRAGTFAPEVEIALHIPERDAPVITDMFRLPTVSAVAFWILHNWLKGSEQARGIADLNNKETYRHALHIAHAMKASVNNGAWRDDGTIAVENLSPEDREYLGITDK